MSEDLCGAGYENVTSIDYSGNVIRYMRERCAHLPQLTWHEMDMRALTFPDGAFDAVVDKATLDALLCEARGDAWNPAPAVVADAERAVAEAWRVLRPGGRLLYLTFGQPHFRRRYFDAVPWTASHMHVLGDAFHYFFYVYTK